MEEASQWPRRRLRLHPTADIELRDSHFRFGPNCRPTHRANGGAPFAHRDPKITPGVAGWLDANSFGAARLREPARLAKHVAQFVSSRKRCMRSSSEPIVESWRLQNGNHCRFTLGSQEGHCGAGSRLRAILILRSAGRPLKLGASAFRVITKEIRDLSGLC
jgi:hypothetical protein